MKKKTNELISNWIFPIIGIGGLIIGIVFSEKLTFIPDISFCVSKPIFLCDVPLINRLVKVLDTRFITAMLIYVVIFSSAYFILHRLGFKEPDEKEDNNKKNKDQI